MAHRDLWLISFGARLALVGLLLPSASLAEKTQPADIPRAAPPSALKVEPKGPLDPYPKADRIVQNNSARWLDMEYGGFQAWDDSGAGYAGDDLKRDPRLHDLMDRVFASFEKCQSLTEIPLPRGVRLSQDLHDFVVSPELLRLALASKGAVFVPAQSDGWRLLTFSFYLDGNFAQKGGGDSVYIKTRKQIFQRLLFFYSDLAPKAFRDAVVAAAAQRGYKDTTPDTIRKYMHDSGEFTVLSQQVTAWTANSAYVVVDRIDGDETKRLRKLAQHCLKSDDLGNNWLDSLNPATGRPYREGPFTTGYIVQYSVLPLGEDTEYYTNAHVNARLAKERNMTPEQIAEERRAEEERIFREAAKNAPDFQKLLADSKALSEKSIPAIEQLQRETLPKVGAGLREAGADPTFVQKIVSQVNEGYEFAKRRARELADYIGRRLRSFWE